MQSVLRKCLVLSHCEPFTQTPQSGKLRNRKNAAFDQLEMYLHSQIMEPQNLQQSTSEIPYSADLESIIPNWEVPKSWGTPETPILLPDLPFFIHPAYLLVN